MFMQMIGIAVVGLFLTLAHPLPATAASQDAALQRQEQEKAAEQKLTELDKGMQGLDAEAKKKEGRPRAEMNRLYEEFKKKQGSARKDLEDMRNATNESWEKVKTRMDKAIEDLNGLYERSKAKMKGNGKDEAK